MTDAERIQLPDGNAIAQRAARYTELPDVLAEQIGRLAYESRLPGQILPSVAYVFSDHSTHPSHRQPELATTDEKLGSLLIEHYPDAVLTLVTDRNARRHVLRLWKREQRPEVEAGRMSVVDWH
jgi:hypothetical protein